MEDTAVIMNYRSELGPDLMFVVLSMDKEEAKKRLAERHQGQEEVVEMLEVIMMPAILR